MLRTIVLYRMLIIYDNFIGKKGHLFCKKLKTYRIAVLFRNPGFQWVACELINIFTNSTINIYY